MDTVKIIGSDGEAGFDFARAWVGGRDGFPSPRAVVGGVECNIETKPGPLSDGIALCEPVASLPDWPVWVEIERTRADGSVEKQTLWGFTDRAGVVDAARRFAALSEVGEVKIGTTL